MKPNPESIFHEARQLSGEARQAYLKGACGSDLALRSKVEALLVADEQAASFLAERPEDDATLAAGSGGKGSGVMIDRYRLLQKLGEGGFGSVWMAEQREPVKRRVALKIIKLGMDTKQVIARFEAERQALAMMEHPNIAKVLDAGATQTGRPYFVMELVRGVPILEYCDREQLDTRQRLELFVSVCQAIQHAHQKGVIHRDIKPSNILVTLHDGKPVVKVIDFGIAKATSAELTTKTLFTEHRQMIGTPAYMSPEQAEMSGLDIDTRSDIYSLGVLLYELLTGTTPFDVRDLLSKGLVEMMRVIREQEPHKPSTRLSTLGEAASVTAAQRRVDARRLSMILRGDLDWIVMRCLEKDRTRRYETANGLAADIERHLSDLPVSAGPPSAGYRARKFVRRNRPQVIVAGLLVAALLLGGVGTGVGLSRALREKNRADEALVLEAEARRLAERRAGELERVAGYQQAQLSGIDTAAMGLQIREALITRVGEARAGASFSEAQLERRAAELESLLAGMDFTGVALETLDANIFQRALEAAETEFAEQPVLKARMLQTLATTMSLLGLVDRVEAPQRAALEIRRRELGADHPETLESAERLGVLRGNRGEIEPAEEILLEVLGLRSAALGAEHPDTLGTRGELGVLYHRAARYADAESVFREVLSEYERQLGSDHDRTLQVVSDLAGTLRSLGRYDDAEVYFRRALEGRRRTAGGGDRATLIAANRLAWLLVDAGRLAEAEPYYLEALEGLRLLLGDDHPETVGAAMALGIYLASLRRYEDALAYMSEAQSRYARILGEEDPDAVRALNNLAVLYRLLGRYDEAAAYFDRIIEIRTRTLGAEHPSTINTVYNTGGLYGSQRRFEEAEPYYRRALDGFRAALGEEHPTTLTAMHSLGTLLWEMGSEEGIGLLERTLELRLKHLGADHPSTLISMHNLSSSLYRDGEYERSASMSALAIERIGPDDASSAVMYRWQHARSLRALGRFAEAVSVATVAYERAVEAFGPVDASTVRVIVLLVEFHDDWHEAEPAAGHDATAAEWRRLLPDGASPTSGG